MPARADQNAKLADRPNPLGIGHDCERLPAQNADELPVDALVGPRATDAREGGADVAARSVDPVRFRMRFKQDLQSVGYLSPTGSALSERPAR